MKQMTQEEIEKLFERAPEGATHYQPARGEGFNPVFWRVENDVPVEAWAVMGNSTLQHIPKPSYIDDVFERLIPRPTPQWSGEGLPPVGVVCEVEDPFHPGIWCECVILAWDAECAVFSACGDYPYQYDGQIAGCFRPIRTPEQIAAEERLAAINWMEIDAGMCATAFDGDPEARVWVENLIDKGWRKVEQGK